MRNPMVSDSREPDVCKRHPSSFVLVRIDLDNIEVIKMEREHDRFDGSGEELKKIGRESATAAVKYEAGYVVETLKPLERGRYSRVVRARSCET
jgi:hypothetical protein